MLVSRRQPWDLFAILDVVDERSLRRLLARGGMPDMQRSGPMAIPEFMERQQFVKDDQVLAAVVRELNADTDTE